MKRRAFFLGLAVAASGCAATGQAQPTMELTGMLFVIGPHPHASVLLHPEAELGPKSWELLGVNQDFARDNQRKRVRVQGAVARVAGQFRPAALQVERIELIAPAADTK